MKVFLIAAIIISLLPFKATAQRNTRAYEARDSIGKTVLVMANIVNVTIDDKLKTVHIGLSDWRNKEEMLTVLIHLKKMSKSKQDYYYGLKGQTIQFEGKVESINGKAVVNSTEDKINIQTEVAVPTY